MGSQNKSLSLSRLEPFTVNEIGRVSKVPTNTSPHSPTDDILQLQTDTINVLEKRIDIQSFPLEYQNKIKNYYRFSGSSYISGDSSMAKMTKDTMDLI
jgi:hypothetical protein